MFDTEAPASHRGEHVGARDQVRDLVAAPRVPLDADPLRIDEALRDDGVDGGDDALLGALARIAGVVDDVRHQHDVAVADVAGDVDAGAGVRARDSCAGPPTAPRRCRPSSGTSSPGRSSPAWRGSRAASCRRRCVYCISSALPQTYSACCGLAFDTFFMSRKLRVADPEVRELVEARLREDDAVGVLRLDRSARTTCRPSRSSRARPCRVSATR